MKVVACTVVALSAVSLAQAQDKPVDPTGTWTWTAPAGGGRRGGGAPGTNVLVLKFEAGKLTGTLTMPPRGGRGGRGRRGGAGGPPPDGATNAAPADAAAPPPPAPVKVDITDGKVVGDTVSFKIVQSFGGNDVTIPYTGKIAGDTITGTTSRPPRGGGDPVETPWTATKQK